MLNAGDLRHRVDIQRRVATQQPSGAMVYSWQDEWTSVPAAIKPLSAREFIAAQATQSQISAQIVVRYVAGITAKHRIVHADKVYNIHGVLVDPDSGIEFITMPVSEGTNEGE